MNPILQKYEDLVKSVQEAFEIDRKTLLGKSKVRSACEPRMVLMWLLRIAQGLSLPQTSEAMQRTNSAIISACRNVEADPELLGVAKQIALKHGLATNQELEKIHQSKLKLWRELCGIDMRRRVPGHIY